MMKREGGKRLNNILRNPSANKPLVSIITAVLNGEKYLEHTIQSVLEQSYDNIEYIIIDGGSTDKTLEIIQQYDKSIDYWISHMDNGISSAFNLGIENAKGDIIGIINSDDWYEPDAVKKVVNIFVSTNPDLVCGAIQFWQHGKKIISSLSEIARIKRETSIHHSTVFIKKKIYETFGNFDVNYKYAMDYELLLRYKMEGIKFYLLNYVIANRRLEGISYINRKQALKETKLARLKHFSKLNVWVNYIYIVVKDYAGRLLKGSVLLPLYRYYWIIKNKKLSKGQLS